MEKQLKILKLESGKSAEIKMIEHSMKSLQNEVQGHFGYLQVTDGIDVWFNEEFLFMDYSPTIFINGQLLHGPVFFAGHDGEGETRSLTHQELFALTRDMVNVEVSAEIRGASND